MTPEQIQSGSRLAAAITRRHARTFYFASLFLPPDQRRAAYHVYAVCRRSDDAVDHPAGEPALSIEAMQAAIDAAYGDAALEDKVLACFRRTVRERRVPKLYFDELIEGMRQDLTKTRYADFGELNDYCYKVAGVIGLIMLKIFDCHRPAAEPFAAALGTAMQLTNIVRDVGEDRCLGRLYLPQDELLRFGVGEDDIFAGRVTGNFRALLRFQIGRAREHYRRCAPGIALLPSRRARFVTRLMKDLYAGILDAVERNDCDVLSRRAHLTLAQKCLRASTVILRGHET